MFKVGDTVIYHGDKDKTPFVIHEVLEWRYGSGNSFMKEKLYRSGTSGYCAVFQESDLELYKPEPFYKIGDIVRSKDFWGKGYDAYACVRRSPNSPHYIRFEWSSNAPKGAIATTLSYPEDTPQVGTLEVVWREKS